MCWWLQELSCGLNSSKWNMTDSISQLTDLSGGRESTENLLSTAFFVVSLLFEFSLEITFSSNKDFALKASMWSKGKF